MKVNMVSEFFENVRAAIRQTEGKLKENKSQRKELIREIRVMKNNIRQGESLCSTLEVGLIVDPAYIRDDLRKKRNVLANLRVQLVGAEASYDVELAKFRALHRQLDKHREPFDREAFARARAK